MSDNTINTITAYQFNRNSQHKEYIGEVVLSDQNGDVDVLESKLQNTTIWLVPGDCTLIQPGPDLSNKKQIYLGNDQWSYIDDFIGTEYWSPLGQKYVISELGQTVPEGMSLTEPPPSIEQLKSNKSKELLTKVNQAIVSGFTSNALGTIHTYGSNETDQLNMTGNVVRSQLPNLPENWTTQHLCGDVNGVWVYRPHTKEQIQQVGEAFNVMKLTLLVRHNEAQNLLTSSQTDTPEKIDAIDFSTVVEGL